MLNLKLVRLQNCTPKLWRSIMILPVRYPTEVSETLGIESLGMAQNTLGVVTGVVVVARTGRKQGGGRKLPGPGPGHRAVKQCSTRDRRSRCCRPLLGSMAPPRKRQTWIFTLALLFFQPCRSDAAPVLDLGWRGEAQPIAQVNGTTVFDPGTVLGNATLSLGDLGPTLSYWSLQPGARLVLQYATIFTTCEALAGLQGFAGDRDKQVLPPPAVWISNLTVPSANGATTTYLSTAFSCVPAVPFCRGADQPATPVQPQVISSGWQLVAALAQVSRASSQAAGCLSPWEYTFQLAANISLMDLRTANQFTVPMKPYVMTANVTLQPASLGQGLTVIDLAEVVNLTEVTNGARVVMHNLTLVNLAPEVPSAFGFPVFAVYVRNRITLGAPANTLPIQLYNCTLILTKDEISYLSVAATLYTAPTSTTDTLATWFRGLAAVVRASNVKQVDNQTLVADEFVLFATGMTNSTVTSRPLPGFPLMHNDTGLAKILDSPLEPYPWIQRIDNEEALFEYTKPSRIQEALGILQLISFPNARVVLCITQSFNLTPSLWRNGSGSVRVLKSSLTISAWPPAQPITLGMANTPGLIQIDDKSSATLSFRDLILTDLPVMQPWSTKLTDTQANLALQGAVHSVKFDRVSERLQLIRVDLAVSREELSLRVMCANSTALDVVDGLMPHCLAAQLYVAGQDADTNSVSQLVLPARSAPHPPLTGQGTRLQDVTFTALLAMSPAPSRPDLITLMQVWQGLSLSPPASTAQPPLLAPALPPSPPASTLPIAPAESNTTSSDGGGSGGTQLVGPIVGAVVGTALLALVVVGVAYYMARKKRKAKVDATLKGDSGKGGASCGHDPLSSNETQATITRSSDMTGSISLPSQPLTPTAQQASPHIHIACGTCDTQVGEKHCAGNGDSLVSSKLEAVVGVQGSKVCPPTLDHALGRVGGVGEGSAGKSNRTGTTGSNGSERPSTWHSAADGAAAGAAEAAAATGARAGAAEAAAAAGVAASAAAAGAAAEQVAAAGAATVAGGAAHAAAAATAAEQEAAAGGRCGGGKDRTDRLAPGEHDGLMEAQAGGTRQDQGNGAGAGLPGRRSAAASGSDRPRRPSLMNELAALTQDMEAKICDKRLEISDVIGSGGYSTVYRGLWQGLPVAVKTVIFARGGDNKTMALQEAAISKSINHPHIVATYAYDLEPIGPGAGGGGLLGGALQLGAPGGASAAGSGVGMTAHEWRLYLVMEYCDQGCLKRLIRNQALLLENGEPDMVSILELAYQVAQGMLHLHSKQIIHGDLKPENVLLKTDKGNHMGLTARVADFGLSVSMSEPQSHVSNWYKGTPFYVSPEVCGTRKLSKASDVFSYGVMLWEMYHSRLVWRHTKDRTGIELHPDFPSFPPSAPERYVLLVRACIQQDPSLRPTFEQVGLVLRQVSLDAPTQQQQQQHLLQWQPIVIQEGALEPESFAIYVSEEFVQATNSTLAAAAAAWEQQQQARNRQGGGNAALGWGQQQRQLQQQPQQLEQ